MSCYRRTGKRDIFRATATAEAVAKGDIVTLDNSTGARDVDVAATNTPVFGISDAAADAGATVLIDMLHPGDQVWVQIQTGTMSDTEVGKYADIEDEDGITLTESNNDFLILGWDGKTTNWCYGVFVHLENTIGT